MKKLWTALDRELAAGRPAVLCSIVASRGSTPLQEVVTSGSISPTARSLS